VGFEQYSSISIAAFLEKLLLLRSWVQLPPGPFLSIRVITALNQVRSRKLSDKTPNIKEESGFGFWSGLSLYIYQRRGGAAAFPIVQVNSSSTKRA
jgi:hypothetical protein